MAVSLLSTGMSRSTPADVLNTNAGVIGQIEQWIDKYSCSLHMSPYLPTPPPPPSLHFNIVCVFLQFVCFNISGTNLSAVVRSLLFKSMLRQDKGWYDNEENSTATLTTFLSVEADQVQGVSTNARTSHDTHTS